MSGQVWKVVGGTDKGGIVVRTGQDLKSDATDERLSCGALVQELQLAGERLQYRRMTGSGPETGWVSISLKGKDLLVRTDEWPEEEKFVFNEEEVPVETRTAADDFKWQKKRADAWRMHVEKHGCQLLPPWIRPDPMKLMFSWDKKAPGAWYGLEFPPTIDALEADGPAWLTQALHRAGTLEKTNSVTKFVKLERLPLSGKHCAGGAGAKAFLTVEYEHPDPSLHTELFVKLPWGMGSGTVDEGHNQKWRIIISSMGDSDSQEMTIYRYMGPMLPFKIPKYYYADINRDTTNWILITERVKFLPRDRADSAAPFEVLPCASKYLDFELPLKMQVEIYYKIMRAQARLAGWDKAGKFECLPQEIRGAEQIPPGAWKSFRKQWPMKIPAERREKMKADVQASKETLKDFIWGVASKIFPDYIADTGFRDYVLKLTEEGFPYQQDATRYCCLDEAQGEVERTLPSAYYALQHGNLQGDNAYFWYDSQGELDAGLIDWGGASRKTFISAMQLSLASMEGELLAEHEAELCKLFCQEYAAQGGPTVSSDRLLKSYRLSRATNVKGSAGLITDSIYPAVERDIWPSIEDKMDPRCLNHWECRCFYFQIINDMKYLHQHWRSGLNLCEYVEKWRVEENLT